MCFKGLEGEGGLEDADQRAQGGVCTSVGAVCTSLREGWSAFVNGGLPALPLLRVRNSIIVLRVFKLLYVDLERIEVSQV